MSDIPWTANQKYFEEDEGGHMSKNNDWVLMCSNKYFKLTGTSPDLSFWGFCQAIGLGENIKAFENLYKEMEKYFEVKK